MSQPQQAGSQASQQAINELIEEIAFQQVLLASIDGSVQNREAAEAEVREENRALESQLRALKRGTTTTASNSQLSSSSHSTQATVSSNSPSTMSSHSLSQDNTVSGSAMDGTFSKYRSLLLFLVNALSRLLTNWQIVNNGTR